MADKYSPPQRVSGSSTATGGESWSSKTKLGGLGASLRLFSESMVRIEQAETEMAMAREASRLKAEKGRAELEAELTRMMAHTQLHIAAILARKRKRANQEEEDNKEGADAMMLNLLQSNTFL